MMMSALIVVQVAEMAVGLTANERFKAVQKLDSGSNFMTSRGFTFAMVLVLVGSIITFLVVTFLRRAREKQTAQAIRPGSPQAATTQNGRKPVTAKNNRPTDANTNQAFMAIFPFAKKIDLSGLVQSGAAGQLPRFLPAKVVGVVGRVVSVETTLSANVGDRVLLVIEADGINERAGARELIEDTGVVQQSVQPADSIDAPNSRRLAIALAGLSEAQIAQIAGIVGGAKANQTNSVKEEIK